MSNEQPELDAPEVKVTQSDFVIDTPSSTDTITKKGYWVHCWGKPATDTNFYALSSQRVEEDGAGVISKIKKDHERLRGHKHVDFRFTLENNDTERLGKSKVTSVAS
ncbi:hypothetical protein [Pseudomonas sp. BGI-2]|uniref:hypothetical protein n=1 Tax=Pseudomonas sp. BGI-2 TaxID=2528211 RepID=UPI001034AEA6|nr:hypothetical protein [Pseudomonas sp. BGI-2]TBN47434.1 hypothetical protein EYC95_10065 [Pseudomonas sp. BGI-2]